MWDHSLGFILFVIFLSVTWVKSMLITFSAATKQGGIANSTDDRSKAQWNQQAGTLFKNGMQIGRKGHLALGAFITSISLPWETWEFKLKNVRHVYVVGSDGSTSASESSLELCVQMGTSHFKGFIKEMREIRGRWKGAESWQQQLAIL